VTYGFYLGCAMVELSAV